MVEEFPALLEKIARLEGAFTTAAARISELEAELQRHTCNWKLTLQRDGGAGGQWALPSDGEFAWEGDGVAIRLVKE